MAGYGSKTSIGDGEGITGPDLESLQDFQRRSLADEFLYQRAGSPQNHRRAYRDELRPLQAALMPICNGVDLDMAITHGSVMAIISGSQELSDLSLEPEMLWCYTNGQTLTFSAGDAALWRRDLVQARIVEAPEAQILRHFEDGITRVKTSQLVTKRTNLTVEVAIKEGGLVASSALADVIAAEPAPDAGWFRIASIRVDPTAVLLDQRNLWDWRMPMGAGGTTKLPPDFDTEDPACWNLKNFTFQQLVGACQARVYLCNEARQLSSFSDGSFFRYDQRRIESVVTLATFVLAGSVSSIGAHASVALPGFAVTQDVLARTVSHPTPVTRVLYRAEDTGFDSGGWSGLLDPPLWANGRRNPAYSPSTGNGTQPPYEEAAWDYLGSAGIGADQAINAVATNWWGGF